MAVVGCVVVVVVGHVEREYVVVVDVGVQRCVARLGVASLELSIPGHWVAADNTVSTQVRSSPRNTHTHTQTHSLLGVPS
ncbi:hypothetical protein Pmani_022304 [Petrolisthes manimaculis]|uniref:Uncharacterized protein n=1 Tax=Petrolisthes manimaculis TaxID=1843537 RepID=A0AAE1PE91_9EUCA|nr:hypothetical protein Pmani_022304 [Petrolisthes manimaculis]